MKSEGSYGADVKGLTASARELRDHLRRYKVGNPNLENVEVRVGQSDGDKEPDSPESVAIVIIFQADTAAHAEQHANELIEANPEGSTTCTSTGEAEVTCEYTE